MQYFKYLLMVAVFTLVVSITPTEKSVLPSQQHNVQPVFLLVREEPVHELMYLNKKMNLHSALKKKKISWEVIFACFKKVQFSSCILEFQNK